MQDCNTARAKGYWTSIMGINIHSAGDLEGGAPENTSPNCSKKAITLKRGHRLMLTLSR